MRMLYFTSIYYYTSVCTRVSRPVHVPSWMVYGMTFDIERCQILRTIDNFFIFFQNHSFSLF